MSEIRDGKEMIEEMKRGIQDTEGSSAYSWSRDRPYDGQPQTSFGERGKTIVEGLTFRDLMDCFISGVLRSCDQPELQKIADCAIYEKMYETNIENVDPGAIWQNMACQIEKMMGIYPNVPKLTSEHWPNGTGDE